MSVTITVHNIVSNVDLSDEQFETAMENANDMEPDALVNDKGEVVALILFRDQLAIGEEVTS